MIASCRYDHENDVEQHGIIDEMTTDFIKPGRSTRTPRWFELCPSLSEASLTMND
ncbi:hypothetical protein RRSWK_00567 [Rhodopirellula sp. SWK7]|nr:hypothetical protein RRSWK_00567 [Rhodopirellula sp. SWK7]